MKFILISLQLLLLPDLLMGQSDFTRLPENSDILVKLNEKGKELQSLKAQFHQVKTIKSLGVEVQMTGQFWYRKPDNIRWQYLTPTQYNIVMVGGQIQSTQLKQTTGNADKQQAFDQLASVVQMLLGGKGLQTNEYTQRCYTSEEKIKVELEPRQAEQQKFVRNMVLYFDNTSLIIQNIQLTEVSGDVISIKFIAQKLNTSIDDSIFTLP